ncbi:MAG: hypothetical protein AB1416_10560 [Actinomycetota bacterium]
MGAVPEGWMDLVGDLEPHVSPDWTRNAKEHAEQAWVRLVILVDAHHQLSNPRIAEKIAMTMADLAPDRGAEQQGWNAVRERAQEDRMAMVARLVDLAPGMLPEELVPFFIRSVDPVSAIR